MQNILFPIEGLGCSAPTSRLAPIWELMQAVSNTQGPRSVGDCSEAQGSLLTFMLESSFTNMPGCWCSKVLKFAFVSQQHKQTECFFLLSPSPLKVGRDSGRLHSQCWPEINPPGTWCLMPGIPDESLICCWLVQKIITVLCVCFYEKFLRIISKLLSNLLMQNVATLKLCSVVVNRIVWGFWCVFYLF